MIGFNKPLGFTGTSGKYLHGKGAKPPTNGPLYMTPVPGGKAITFTPPPSIWQRILNLF